MSDEAQKEGAATPSLSRRSAVLQLGASLGATLLPACDPLVPDLTPPPAPLGSFPYHPLVYHLDLSILSYQLYCQSLVWAIDPYYEERVHDNGVGRDEFMASVRAWVERQGEAQAGITALDSYRGPGALGGFPDNPSHDPILYNYARLHPWSDAIMNGLSRWTEYLTPREITGRISEVWVSYRQAGGEETDVVIEPVPLARDDRDEGATDVLIAFEGGTGDKGEAGQPASQSLMGFVLLRATGAESYDVHVTFRGSRSGSAARAAIDALSTEFAAGNPDWITDLGFRLVSAADGAGDITTVGSVSRGMSRSMRSMLPTLFLAFEKVAELTGDTAPTHIFVTGHSLGGGLAQHFVSAVLLGDQYGPGGAGQAMPEALATWPWKQIKLISFSAPRVGDTQWAQALTTEELDSEFFHAPISPYDIHARYVTDPEIVDRLHDAARPAGFRLLISTDPVTTQILPGGSHVGKTVYVNGDLLTDWFGLPSAAAHEPENIRTFMTDAMGDPRTPARAWRYTDLAELDPSRDDDQAGSRAEMQKLGDALLRYYADAGQWLDEDAFRTDLELMFELE